MGIELKNIDIEGAWLDLVKEQLALYFKSVDNINIEGKDLNVVSLFSGCGEMDLGFEGGFKAHKSSILKARSFSVFSLFLFPFLRIKILNRSYGYA